MKRAFTLFFILIACVTTTTRFVHAVEMNKVLEEVKREISGNRAEIIQCAYGSTINGTLCR